MRRAVERVPSVVPELRGTGAGGAGSVPGSRAGARDSMKTPVSCWGPVPVPQQPASARTSLTHGGATVGDTATAPPLWPSAPTKTTRAGERGRPPALDLGCC